MEYFVEREEGCRLHVKEEGSGPVILFIHGAATDSSFFAAAAKILADNFTVITYDRRGYSDSTALPGADYSPAAQAADAAAILDRAGCRAADAAAIPDRADCQVADAAAIPDRADCRAADATATPDRAGCQKAIVVTSSAGGIVGLELALTYPDRVRMLIMHETPLAPDLEAQNVFDSFVDQLAGLAKAGKITRAMLVLTKSMGGRDRNAPPVEFAQIGRNMENLRIFLQEEMEEFFTYRKRHDKIELAMPCCLASGDQDCEGLFSKLSSRTAEFLGCSYMRVKGYHNLAWDDPKAFADYVRKALKISRKLY